MAKRNFAAEKTINGRPEYASVACAIEGSRCTAMPIAALSYCAFEAIEPSRRTSNARDEVVP